MNATVDKRNKSPPMQRNSIKLNIDAKRKVKNRLGGKKYQTAQSIRTSRATTV